MLVGNESYQVINQSDFKVERQEKLKGTVKNLSSAAIVNMSPVEYFYNSENLKKFVDLTSVPQQDWYLVVNEPLNDLSYQRYQLTNASDSYKVPPENPSTSDLTLEDVSASDIIQLSNLLESRSEGTFALPNNHSVLTSTGVD